MPVYSALSSEKAMEPSLDVLPRSEVISSASTTISCLEWARWMEDVSRLCGHLNKIISPIVDQVLTANSGLHSQLVVAEDVNTNVLSQFQID